MQKGPMDVKLDGSAVSEIIVYANGFKRDVDERAQQIREICSKMTENETLQGGDGEEIKAAFKAIAAGCQNIETSTATIVAGLNTKLEKIIEMTKGKSTAEALEAAQAAAKNMGAVKKH